MKTHSKITPQEREKIYCGLVQDKSISAIAKELGRHRSSISREIRRNGMSCVIIEV